MLKHALDIRQIRYVISGVTGLAVNVGIFTLLLKIFHESSYFASAIAAFGSFWVSYFMQKYFTFQKTSQVFHFKDIVLFLIAALFNTAMISGFYFFFTHVYDVKVVDQVLASGCAAVISYFVYKHLVFT